MLSMSRKAMILMVLMLAAATAATAATAFAGSRKKQPDVAQQVVDAIQISSDAAARAKIRPLKTVRVAELAAVKVPIRR
jgi:hypothetical protein